MWMEIVVDFKELLFFGCDGYKSTVWVFQVLYSFFVCLEFEGLKVFCSGCFS